MWKSEIAEVVKEDLGKENWARYVQEADNVYGHAGGLRKNSLHIAKTLALAWDEGKRSTNLERLGSAILNFAREVSPEQKS